ncbi:hypothetical protein WA026_009196 [Henosepilachna vigintioctopunctata]|uniref:Uncharacterized protein n=1 Tax=Henosepilachna vigintioctopunctata TaxID=420089 RepID=A0AAW1UVV8_9CUCU
MYISLVVNILRREKQLINLSVTGLTLDVPEEALHQIEYTSTANTVPPLEDNLSKLKPRLFQYKKAKKVFSKHVNLSYPNKSVLTSKNTKAIVKRKAETVINQVNVQRRLDVENNRKGLIPIIQKKKTLWKTADSFKRSLLLCPHKPGKTKKE